MGTRRAAGDCPGAHHRVPGSSTGVGRSGSRPVVCVHWPHPFPLPSPYPPSSSPCVISERAEGERKRDASSRLVRLSRLLRRSPLFSATRFPGHDGNHKRWFPMKWTRLLPGLLRRFCNAGGKNLRAMRDAGLRRTRVSGKRRERSAGKLFGRRRCSPKLPALRNRESESLKGRPFHREALCRSLLF